MHPPSEPDPSIFVEPEPAPSETAMLRDESSAPAAAARAARYGIWLCLVYVLLYGGFIATAIFRHDLMARPVVAGVNFAIVYGIVLIGAALLLALVYMMMCRVRRAPAGETGARGGAGR